MSLTPNVQAMVNAGYCVSPNNIYSLPGCIMYAAGPGIMEPVKATLLDINVHDNGVSLVYSRWNDGKFVGLETTESFASVAEYLAWVAENGKPSEPGLPAFYNSWD